VGLQRRSAQFLQGRAAYAWVFHEMFRHTEVFKMGGFTFATSLLSANRTQAELNPAGLLFKLYRDHFGTLPVAVAGNSPPPPPRYPVGGEQPQVNAGSPTHPLDVAAALTSDRKALTFAVINPTESEQPLILSIEGVSPSGQGRRWRMAPASVDATIVVARSTKSRSKKVHSTPCPRPSPFLPSASACMNSR